MAIYTCAAELSKETVDQAIALAGHPFQMSAWWRSRAERIFAQYWVKGKPLTAKKLAKDLVRLRTEKYDFA